MNDGAVSFAYFKRALKALNGRFVIDLSKTTANRGVMVYLNIPSHPDSDPETGLWEVLAVPSPIFYPKMPKHDTEWVDAKGVVKWVRGWGTFIKAICKMKDPWGRKIASKDKAKAWFEKPFDKFNSRAYIADIAKRRDRQLALARLMADKRYVFDPREMPSYMGA